MTDTQQNQEFVEHKKHSEKKLTKKEQVAKEQAAIIKKLRSQKSMRPILQGCTLDELTTIQQNIFTLTEEFIEAEKKQLAQVEEQKAKALEALNKLKEQGIDLELIRALI